jgi:hypothetical protein
LTTTSLHAKQGSPQIPLQSTPHHARSKSEQHQPTREIVELPIGPSSHQIQRGEKKHRATPTHSLRVSVLRKSWSSRLGSLPPHPEREEREKNTEERRATHSVCSALRADHRSLLPLLSQKERKKEKKEMVACRSFCGLRINR